MFFKFYSCNLNFKSDMPLLNRLVSSRDQCVHNLVMVRPLKFIDLFLKEKAL